MFTSYIKQKYFVLRIYMVFVYKIYNYLNFLLFCVKSLIEVGILKAKVLLASAKKKLQYYLHVNCPDAESDLNCLCC